VTELVVISVICACSLLFAGALGRGLWRSGAVGHELSRLLGAVLLGLLAGALAVLVARPKEAELLALLAWNACATLTAEGALIALCGGRYIDGAVPRTRAASAQSAGEFKGRCEGPAALLRLEAITASALLLF
jgi:hypothetical protein